MRSAPILFDVQFPPTVMITLSLFCCFGLLNSQPTELTLPSDVQILSATRNVDMSSQIIKVKTDFDFKNDGKEAIGYFVHTIPVDEAKHLSWMSAYETSKESGKYRISRVKVKGAPNVDGFVFHKLELLNLLAPGSSVKITVDFSLTQYLVPHPKEIGQNENQLVLFTGLANIPSAYPVVKETCIYKIGTPVGFTKIEPSKHASDKITYGPYENTPAYAKKPVTIHYENNSPFLVATNVERVIEISHWGGNIAVEEHIEIVNKGAKLKGSFSRLDFQMDRRGGRQPIVKSIKTILPPSSQDIYYRDEIGNISTSNVYPRTDRVEVELRPRFPLFGGWRTDYVLGYNIPGATFLHHSGSNFGLKMKMMDRLYDNAVVEKLKLKLILPEMSKNIKLVTPYSVKRLQDEVHKTYLDTFGRPVIVIEKENLVNNHIQTFTLYYDFERIYMFREPAMVVCAFGLLFLAAIILFRLDFSITAKEGSGKEAATTSGHQKKD